MHFTVCAASWFSWFPWALWFSSLVRQTNHPLPKLRSHPGKPNQKRPVHELLAGAFRNKSSISESCLCSQGKTPEFTEMGEIARSKSRIASDLKTRDSNRWRPCGLKLRFETRDWRFVLNIPIQQNCEKGCDLSPRSKIASDWRLAILPI